MAELDPLTQALGLAEGITITIYSASKFAFLVLHAHATVWQEREFLTSRDSWRQPCCPNQGPLNTVEAKGNWMADPTAKQAALQEPFLATLYSRPLPTPTCMPKERTWAQQEGLEPQPQDTFTKKRFLFFP